MTLELSGIRFSTQFHPPWWPQLHPDQPRLRANVLQIHVVAGFPAMTFLRHSGEFGGPEFDDNVLSKIVIIVSKVP